MYLSSHLNEIREVLCAALAEKSSHVWKEPGNKYEHGLRTARLALLLKAQLGITDTQVPPDLLTVAAWFHDVCNSADESDHENAGADLLPSLIGRYCTPDELNAVQEIIRVHDTRIKNASLDERLQTYSHAVLLLQDADLLDHLGTYSIWATFSDLVYRHKTPEDYVIPFENGAFDRWAQSWRIKMNYPLALQYFDEKINYEKDFAARMKRELSGEFQ